MKATRGLVLFRCVVFSESRPQGQLHRNPSSQLLGCPKGVHAISPITGYRTLRLPWSGLHSRHCSGADSPVFSRRDLSVRYSYRAQHLPPPTPPSDAATHPPLTAIREHETLSGPLARILSLWLMGPPCVNYTDPLKSADQKGFSCLLFCRMYIHWIRIWPAQASAIRHACTKTKVVTEKKFLEMFHR